MQIPYTSIRCLSDSKTKWLESKWQQDYRTFFSVPADLNNILVRMVLISPPISSHFSKLWGTIPSVSIKIGHSHVPLSIFAFFFSFFISRFSLIFQPGWNFYSGSFVCYIFCHRLVLLLCKFDRLLQCCCPLGYFLNNLSFRFLSWTLPLFLSLGDGNVVFPDMTFMLTLFLFLYFCLCCGAEFIGGLIFRILHFNLCRGSSWA